MSAEQALAYYAQIGMLTETGQGLANSALLDMLTETEQAHDY